MPNRTDTYYASGAFHGYGSQLMVGNGASPELFEAIAEVLTITPGAMTTASIERTHLRSPEAHREKMPGLRDSGPFTLTGNWRPTEQSQKNAATGGSVAFTGGGLMGLWRTRKVKNFKIVLSDGSPGTSWPFTGFISNFTPGEVGVDDKVGFTCEITPSEDFSADLP